MSEKDGLPTIQQVFAAAKKAIGPVGKTGKNTQQNYNFRGVDAVVNAAAPHLDEHGVIPLPVLQDIEYTTVEVGSKRTPMAHVRVKVTYQFWGPAGDHLDATVPGEAMDSGDKATAKAMSVAYRIALLQALNLPTSDPDPDTQSYERSPREDWRNSPPVNRPRHEANGHAASADDEWVNEHIELAATFPDAETGRMLYRKVVAKQQAGEITAEQRRQLCELIEARGDDLNKEAGQPAADPWQSDISAMSTRDHALALLDKLETARKGGLVDGRRYAALKAAIRTKANSLPEAVPA